MYDHSTQPHAEQRAAELRGFGPVGILAIAAILLTGNIAVTRILIVPVGAVLVLVWAHWSRTPWRDLGFARPKSWLRTITAGVAIGVALKLVMKAVVMPLLGADPVNQAFRFLQGNPALIPAALFSMMFGAGFGEETVFRGYMFERLQRLFGWTPAARVGIVVFTSLLFGAGHYAIQGVPGVQQAVVVGLVFGSLFAATRDLWLVITAHIAFDLTAYAIIYWNLESDVAQWIFR